MAYTRAWDETDPTDETYGYDIDDKIRNLREDVRERLDNEHSDVSGGSGLNECMHQWAVTAKSTGSPYTALITDHVLLITTGASDYTINLPSAATYPGKPYKIKKVDSGIGAVVIDADESETIDGALQWILNGQNNFVDIISDGTNWVIVSESISTVPVNFQSYEKNLFGDGSDGDVTISEDTTLDDSGIGIKIMRYNNLTIDAGYYLEPHANDKIFVVLVKGTLTINGTLKVDGRGGIGGVHVTAIPQGGGAGAFGGGGGGKAAGVGGQQMGAGGGGAGQGGQNGAVGAAGLGGGNGANGKAIVSCFPKNAGGFCPGGGGEGGWTSNASAGERFIDDMLTPFHFEAVRDLTGGGGGAGGDSDAAEGGDGGGGGGILWIEANTIVWGANGVISSNGIDGAAGPGGGTGGGGGGAGGFVQVAYGAKSGTSDIQANGGAGGIGSYTGGAGADGLTGEFQIL